MGTSLNIHFKMILFMLLLSVLFFGAYRVGVSGRVRSRTILDKRVERLHERVVEHIVGLVDEPGQGRVQRHAAQRRVGVAHVSLLARAVHQTGGRVRAHAAHCVAHVVHAAAGAKTTRQRRRGQRWRPAVRKHAATLAASRASARSRGGGRPRVDNGRAEALDVRAVGVERVHAEAVDDEQLLGGHEHGPLAARCGRQAQRRGACAAATGAGVKAGVERETSDCAHRLLADTRVLAAQQVDEHLLHDFRLNGSRRRAQRALDSSRSRRCRRR